MLIQEGMSELKIINKKLDRLKMEIQKYSVWNNKKTHPLGKVGTDEYSKKEAEKILTSKLQSYKDLMDRYMQIKLAIKRTNLETVIEVAGEPLSITEALIIKDFLSNYQKDLIRALVNAEQNANREIEQYNYSLPSDAEEVNMAKIWYLIDPASIDDINLFVDQFAEEVDGALQVANCTTHLIGIEDDEE